LEANPAFSIHSILKFAYYLFNNASIKTNVAEAPGNRKMLLVLKVFATDLKAYFRVNCDDKVKPEGVIWARKGHFGATSIPYL